ncbi:MAG TPA: hypothetical protein VNN10_01865 [Dehalococcoidia bacterium]|nr:hypothetical protein [Dehalococcoidia bacterium]
MRLPTNPFLEALSEEPLLAVEHLREPFPWREISPSIALVVAIVIVLAGVRMSSFVVPLAGGIMAAGSFFWAAVLEFQVNRRATRSEGDPAAMGMLSYSSDWPAVRGGRRRM